jgi:hypothetical protein
MRHNLLSGPIAAGARCMLQASATAGLIALPRRSLRLLSRFLCAGPGAVNLATVAVTADHYWKAAACAHKQPSRRGLRTVRCPTWTRAATSGIMPRHACSARCRGTASRRDLPVAIGAVPSQSEQQVVSPLQCARQAAFPSPNARRPVDMWTTQGRCPHIHRPNSSSIHIQFDEF